MSDSLAGPWIQVCANFHDSVTGTSSYISVVIDEHPRYPEVCIVRSTSAEAVIPKMDRMFAVHGIAEQVWIYNSPPVPRPEKARIVLRSATWKASKTEILYNAEQKLILRLNASSTAYSPSPWCG